MHALYCVKTETTGAANPDTGAAIPDTGATNPDTGAANPDTGKRMHIGEVKVEKDVHQHGGALIAGTSTTSE